MGIVIAHGGRMLRALILYLLTGCVAHADECPLPQIAVRSTASGDAGFDVGYSRELVGGLIVAAERDAARALADRRTVGAEVAALGRGGDDRLAAYEALSLAIRLRQLDCAVWSNRVAAPNALYRSIADDGRAQIARLGGAAPILAPPEPSDWRLPAPTILPPKPDPKINPAHRALDYKVGGGVLLGAATAFVAGAIALTVEAARWQAPPPCTADDWFCLNDLDRALHDLNVGAAAAMWLFGAVSTVAGGALIYSGNRWAEKARLTPSLAVGPGGGSVGMRLSF